jgi:predicted DNA-binding protein YlxM (UPF0122 family)
MEKLMKPAEYAKELGISRQAVYAKIKRGILTAKDVEGKLYIVVDNEAEETPKKTVSTAAKNDDKPAAAKRTKTADTKYTPKEYEALLAAKDETISVLKGTVKDLKKSHKQISTTLRGEIDLLKEAFHEMRTLYMHQLEHKQPETEAIDVVTDTVESETETEWVSVKKFFKKTGVEKTKRQEKLLKRLKKAWKSGDSRLQKFEGKLKIDIAKNCEDLVR